MALRRSAPSSESAVLSVNSAMAMVSGEVAVCRICLARRRASAKRAWGSCARANAIWVDSMSA